MSEYTVNDTGPSTEHKLLQKLLQRLIQRSKYLTRYKTNIFGFSPWVPRHPFGVSRMNSFFFGFFFVNLVQISVATVTLLFYY